MRVSEILRQIADIVDAKEETAAKEQEATQAAQAQEIATAVQDAQDLQAGQVAQLVNAAQNAKAAAGQNDVSDNSAPPAMPLVVSKDELTPCDNDDGSEPATMISPQQQELELLKKSQGVENNVEEFANDDQKMDRVLPADDPMYDASPEDADFERDDFSDELGALKKLSGVGANESEGSHNYAGDIKPVSMNPRAVAANEARGKTDHRLAHTKHKDQK